MTFFNERSSFGDWAEFDSFNSKLKEHPEWEVLEQYESNELDVGFVKTYFKNKGNNQIWVLVEPDPPMRGEWRKV